MGDAVASKNLETNIPENKGVSYKKENRNEIIKNVKNKFKTIKKSKNKPKPINNTTNKRKEIEIENKMAETIMETNETEVFKGFEPMQKKTKIDNIEETKTGTMEYKNDAYKQNKYMPGDSGPYYVIMEKKGIEDLEIAEKLNSLNLGVIIAIKQFGKNRLKIQTREMETANKILKNVDLQRLQHCNSYVPNFMLESIGYINQIPVHTDLEKIKNNINTNSKITKIERINRWNHQEKQIEPTTAIKVTFRTTNLPEKVTIYGVNRKVSYFVPKPILCKKCLIYGHLQKNCRGKEKCLNCTETDHVKTECKNKTKCYYCQENHITNNFICEEYKKQKKIKYLMVTKKISYGEARNTISPKAQKEFNINNENFPELTPNNEEINKLKKEINDIKTNLQQENKKLKEEITGIKTIITEITTINRKIQATTQGYLNTTNKEPHTDIVLTEIIEQLLDMDRTIINKYKQILKIKNDDEQNEKRN